MKVVLYSGGEPRQNAGLDYRLIKLVNHPHPRFAYVPADGDLSEQYIREEFELFKNQYKLWGVNDFSLHPLSKIQSRFEKNYLFSAQVIFFGGGNTFKLLYDLKRLGLLKIIKRYAEKEGVVAGLSAGAIVLTPQIHTASFPHFDRDENEVGILNWKAVGLTDFEFFPHFEHRPKYIHQLNLESKLKRFPLIAAPDGCGVVVDHDLTTFVGSCWVFFRGKNFRLN